MAGPRMEEVSVARRSQPRPGCLQASPASSLLSSTTITPTSTSSQADKASRRAARVCLESKPSQRCCHINLVSSSNGNLGKIHQPSSTISLLPIHLKTKLISPTPPQTCASSPPPLPPHVPTRCPPPQPLSPHPCLQTANLPLQPPSIILFPPLMQISVTITSRCLQGLHPATTPYEWVE